MDQDRFPDPDRDPDEGGRVNHLAYLLLALIVMLIFWYGTG